MKRLTILCILILFTVFFTDCENVTIDPNEKFESELSVESTESFLKKLPVDNDVSMMAKPSDLIATVTLPVPGFGISVGVDCVGNIYYTHIGNTNLFKMDKDGNLLATIPIATAGGVPKLIDEISWDRTNQVFWGAEYNTIPVEIYTIDPTNGLATFAFTAANVGGIPLTDGLAFDGTDDTLWISSDVSSTIQHYESDGTFINEIIPKDAGGGALGFISGVMVGVGDLLYLGRNGFVEIVQVKKSNGDFISKFASPGGSRDEGLECDAVNFAPKLVLWSRDIAGFMSVIEVEDGTCLCGGGIFRVDIDIKPMDENTINCQNTKQKIPVAILTTDTFDATTIDHETVLFEGAGELHLNKKTGLPKRHENDADGDGDIDLVLHFLLTDTGLDCSSIEGTLTGMLFDGTPIEGTDVVIMIDPNND